MEGILNLNLEELMSVIAHRAENLAAKHRNGEALGRLDDHARELETALRHYRNRIAAHSGD